MDAPRLREPFAQATITKPERHVDAAFDDFFDLRFVALAHYEHAHEQFVTEAKELCKRFAADPSAPGSLRPTDGKAGVPINGLVVSMREVWRAVKENRDLDLPAHKVMVATVRCEEIAAGRVAHLAGSADLAHLVAATSAAASPPGLSASLASLAAAELAAYDEEATYFDAAVRVAKREELAAKLVAALKPVASAHLGHVSSKLLRRLSDALTAATSKSAADGRKGFAKAAADALADVREQWAAALADAIPENDVREGEGVGEKNTAAAASWACVAADATSGFERDATSAVAAERKERLAETTHACERSAERDVAAAVLGLLDDAPADLWDRVDALVISSDAKHRGKLAAALAEFELGAEETERAERSMRRRVRETVETKCRDAAGAALTAMKTAFARVFGKDSKGLPRVWKASDDVAAANRKAQREALRVLGLLCVLRLRGDASDGGVPSDTPSDEEAHARQEAIDAALATLVPEPALDDALNGNQEEGGGEPHPEGAAVEYPTEWVGEEDDAVILGPAECRSTWRLFEADTAYAVTQALAAKEAAGRGGQPAAPMWMICALVVTAFDEVMWLLRNPFTLLFLIGVGLFLRALYQNLDVETAMAMGVVPGLMFLATKVVPTAIIILKRLVDAGNEGSGSDPKRGGGGGEGVPLSAKAKAVATASPEKKAAGAAKDKTFGPSVSGEGVKHRKPAAMMYPGGEK